MARYDLNADPKFKGSDASREGYEAAREGLPITANPYALFPNERIEWRAGWQSYRS